MGILKRAILYVTRKKGKSILLFCVLFLVVLLTLIALSIQQGTSKAARDLRLSYGSTFTLKVRYDETNPDLWDITEYYVDGELQGSGKTWAGPVIDDELIQQVMSLDGVDNYVADNIYHVLYSEDLNVVPGAYLLDPNEPEDYYWGRLLDYQVTGDSSLHRAFRTGALEIIEGRPIQPGGTGEVLISNVLAQRSGLSVGDTFTASQREGHLMPEGDWEKITAGPFTMEIVGIYKINSQLEPSNYLDIESWYPENYIFLDTSYEDQLGNTGTYDAITFFVQDPKELNRVISEVEQLEAIDPQYFMVRRDDSLYRSSVAPLNTLSTLASILIGAALIGCVILLYLILSMGIKSRSHEIGILLSMGISKIKILSQHFLEILIVFVFAFVASWAVAGGVASPLGNTILSGISPEQGAIKAPEYVMLEGFSYDAPSQTPTFIEIPVAVGETVIVAAGTCGAIAVSIILTGVPILRRNPKDILSSVS